MNKTDKETIKLIMENTNQELIYEDKYNLEYKAKTIGDDSICFQFDNNGKLIEVYS